MDGHERNERRLTPDRKYPVVLVEPGAVRRRLLASSSSSRSDNPKGSTIDATRDRAPIR
jgi:hypothetical protein